MEFDWTLDPQSPLFRQNTKVLSLSLYETLAHVSHSLFSKAISHLHRFASFYDDFWSVYDAPSTPESPCNNKVLSVSLLLSSVTFLQNNFTSDLSPTNLSLSFLCRSSRNSTQLLIRTLCMIGKLNRRTSTDSARTRSESDFFRINHLTSKASTFPHHWT